MYIEPSNFLYQILFDCKFGITTDGRKNLVIGTGPQTLPPPVAVEALPFSCTTKYKKLIDLVWQLPKIFSIINKQLYS